MGLTADQVSEESNIPLSTVYRALNSLHNQGLVEVTPGRPMIFRARHAADLISSALSSSIESAIEAATELMEKLPSASRPGFIEFEVSTGAWLVPLKGTRAIEAACSAIIKRARGRVTLMSGDPKPPFWERLLRLAEGRRGVEVELTVNLGGSMGGVCASEGPAAVWEHRPEEGWVGLATSLPGLKSALCRYLRQE